MESIVIVEFQGFRDDNNKYIVKELYIISGGATEAWLFQPPYEVDTLSAERRKSNRWSSRHLHGFDWEEGSTPYEFLEWLIQDRCRDKTVVTKGLEKTQFLESILKSSVFNLDSVLFTKFENLPEPNIECSYEHRDFNCAKKNAFKLLQWLLKVKDIITP